ncbi:IclR family transcriptional regulator [uncultured Aquincola sp.]|uniref:IclR family transcriptional regulator n=1 Tax=uncultured Aquincola sp. TaxID=886556 RepID=UPI0032B1C15B|tara:strand:- start:41 stop:835 length:795 start_codon:yes stop_codon:yes gene_type:complete
MRTPPPGASPESSPLKGTQAVDRALDLLRRVAAHHPAGITVTALAAEAGLDRATAYRLASSLALSGFVERDPRKRYRLGLQAMQLGLASMTRAPLVEACRPLMQRLARQTGDTVFLVVRNGDYAHCLHCEEGDYPIKALVLQIGGMRVLGVGSAGVTLASRLPDPEIEALHARHRSEFMPTGLSLVRLRSLVATARQQGYSSTTGLVNESVGGVGMSFELKSGGHAAISIAAIRARMGRERKLWMAQLLATELRSAGYALPPPG